MQLQKIVDESIIEWKTGETVNLEVDMKVSVIIYIQST